MFIKLLATDIEAWTKTHGGIFHVARDPLHPYVILAGGSYSSFVVILSYAGGTSLNTNDHPHGMEDASVEVFLGHGMDLRSNPGAWLFEDNGARASMLSQLTDLRAHVLTIAFENPQGIDPSYAESKGIEQAQLADNTPLKAFKINVSWPPLIEVKEADYRFLN